MKTDFWNFFMFCALSFKELEMIVFKKKTIFFQCILACKLYMFD